LAGAGATGAGKLETAALDAPPLPARGVGLPSSGICLREREAVRDVREPTLSLLSRLWLAEPGEEELAAARNIEGFAQACGEKGELARHWTDLFLLNVYPYGTVFSDASAELNGELAQKTAGLFRDRGYAPPELSTTGAPDHLGLCLGFLDYCGKNGFSEPAFRGWLRNWIPVCCAAVEREPWGHPFYRALARETAQRLLAEPAADSRPGAFVADGHAFERSEPGPEEELGLRELLQFFLAPARCGFFLSRARLGEIARGAGLCVPFGSRFDVARALFAAAGESGRVPAVLSALEEEIAGWRNGYERLAAEHSLWEEAKGRWTDRLAGARRRLEGMRELLDSPPEVEYGEARWTDGTARA
jgi:TorA maturation chaperone TorD